MKVITIFCMLFLLMNCSHIITNFKCPTRPDLPVHLVDADKQICKISPEFEQCFKEVGDVDSDLFKTSYKASIYFNYYLDDLGDLKELVINSDKKMSLSDSLDSCLRKIANKAVFSSNPYRDPYEVVFEYNIRKDFFKK